MFILYRVFSKKSIINILKKLIIINNKIETINKISFL